MLVDTMKHIEDDLIDVIGDLEEPVLTSVGSVVETFADFVPARPPWPFVSALPTLSEVVDVGVDFATRFVAQQGEFARRLVRAVDPIAAKVEAKPGRAKAPSSGSSSARATKAPEAKVA
jgi:hypothetical protein